MLTVVTSVICQCANPLASVGVCLVFTKRCRIIDYCREKKPLNFAVDASQKGCLAAIFGFCYNRHVQVQDRSAT